MRKNTIILTNHELALISDAEIMPAKQQIIKKIAETFESIGHELNFTFNQNQVFKVTRGENYEGQPYAVLDYPSLKKEELDNKFRFMFWWGNHFQLQYFKRVTDACEFDSLPKTDWVNIHPNLFNNNPANNQYVRLSDFDASNLPCLVKLIRMVPLNQIDVLETAIKDFVKAYD